jgi:ADP-heptose:LPS heptosyltransferase
MSVTEPGNPTRSRDDGTTMTTRSRFSPKSARRVLVYHTGSMGDNLVALPSFHLVRRTFSEARITALTNFPHEYGSGSRKAVSLESLLNGTALVDEYLQYPYFVRDPRIILRLRREIRRRRFDCLVYLFPVAGYYRPPLKLLRDWLFFVSCGIVRQIGIPVRRRDRNLRPVPGTDRHQREGERLVGCLRSLGQPNLAEDCWWDPHLTDAEDAEADALLGELGRRSRFLAISIGTRSDANDWTDPNWSSLLRILAPEYPDLGLVAIGSHDESDRMVRLLGEWQGPTLNLCGATRGPRIAGAVLRRATLFLGHDSGPMHLAAAVKTPCVAIFSAKNPPGEWFPRGENHRVLYHKTDCFGCRLMTCVDHKKKCIMSISVEEVQLAVKSQLARVLHEDSCGLERAL